MEEMIIRKHELQVDFQNDIFKAKQQIKMVQDDNKSNLLIFDFKDDVEEWQNAIIKIKHYSGTILEYPLEIKDRKAELLVTNEITSVPGEIKLSIVLIGANGEILSINDNQENVIIKEKLTGITPTEFEESVLLELASKNSALKQQIDELETRIETMCQLADEINGEVV